VATDSGARLLIATGAAAEAASELPPLVRALVDGAAEVLVVTPALTSRLQWLASDVDRARFEADERLATVLGHLEEIAPEAVSRGQVGDESPLTAFDDAVRSFRPDHILIALRSTDHSAWQERGLVDAVRERFHIPTTIFELDRLGRAPSEAAG
jgi:hypothetical protein